MKSVNPATEELIAEYPEHSWEQLEQACAAAQAAFAHWRRLPVEARAKALQAIAGVLRDRREFLARLMTREMGKTIVAAEAEVEKCAAACDYFAANGPRFLAARPVESDAAKSYVRFDPLGAVLAIMPWNFPLWQVFRFAAPALVAGNVVLLKHAPNVPGCALAISAVIAEAGLPEGVFASLLVGSNDVAQKLAGHSAIAAVTLTGSERAGAAVASTAGKTLKKTAMELGGSDAFIVLPDADVDTAARIAAEARCINNGQSCIAAKRFIVIESVADRFETVLSDTMSKMVVGDPLDRRTQVGPLARLDLADSLHRQVELSLRQGAIARTGASRRPGRGFFYNPTVLTQVRPGMAAFDEETFGPVAAVIRARDIDHAIRLVNLSRYGLGASIWTTDLARAESLAAELDVGSVFINGTVKSDPRLPFGGVKMSGWGRELGEFGLMEFVNIKTVWSAAS